MSHGLDFSTGAAAMAYVGEQPWHTLGESLPPNQPIEEWLRAARLQWHLKRLPVQYLVDGKIRTMPDRYVRARSDTRDALSIVSDDYQIVQPKEVLEFYGDLVQGFGYSVETAGSLHGGRKVWALARTRLTAHLEICGDDEIGAYVLLATSCDKSLTTTVAFTSVRVVCQNTLSFAVDDIDRNGRKQVKVPHTHRVNADAVKKQLGLLDTSWARFIESVNKAASVQMDAPAAAEFFERVLGRRLAKELGPRAARERAALTSLFRSAPGQSLHGANGTLWGALNAVTFYVDHVRPGGGLERLDSAWFGPGQSLKQAAWTEAQAILHAAAADA
jgi:phage/plasmid-like protein (TIGR03299 family)